MHVYAQFTMYTLHTDAEIWDTYKVKNQFQNKGVLCTWLKFSKDGENRENREPNENRYLSRVKTKSRTRIRSRNRNRVSE